MPAEQDGLQLEPWDGFNQALIAQVRPPQWQNPTPAPLYHLVVVGGGTAGLVTAVGAAGLGAKVALVERRLLGGDCLVTGCVPSKSLLAAARERRGGGSVSFADAMARVRRARARLAPHDSAQRLAGLGIDVYFGEGAFTAADTVSVAGADLLFRRAVIATGATPSVPDLPGLAAAAPLTSDTVFTLTEAPHRLVTIGGGPVGCELAQAFAAFGTEVALVCDSPRLLEQDDPEASAAVAEALRRDGVTLALGATVTAVDSRGGEHAVRIQTATGAQTLAADAILVAAGRRANVDGLSLDTAGVRLAGTGGIQVDDFLQTTNPRIFACGDVALPWKFTHAADAAARIVVQNALFALGSLGRRRVSRLQMSWCTFTEPEVAQIGFTEATAHRAGVMIDTYKRRFEHLDRAVTDGLTDGFLKIHTRAHSDAIVGATIVGARAGDLVGEIGVAMAAGFGLGSLARVIHPYPTYAGAIQACADDYNRTRLTPTARRLLAWWFS